MAASDACASAIVFGWIIMLRKASVPMAAPTPESYCRLCLGAAGARAHSPAASHANPHVQPVCQRSVGPSMCAISVLSHAYRASSSAALLPAAPPLGCAPAPYMKRRSRQPATGLGINQIPRRLPMGAASEGRLGRCAASSGRPRHRVGWPLVAIVMGGIDAKRLVRDLLAHDAFGVAASVAFWFFLSLIPLLVVAGFLI